MSLSTIGRATLDKKLNIQKARDNCKTNRFMSQKLRDQLRKKFYEHVHTARHDRFCQNRAGCFEDDTRKELVKALKQDLAELENDIELQEKIFVEVLEEMNEWIVAEIAMEDDYLVKIAESDELICPMCQKHALDVKISHTETKRNIYHCKCGVSFAFAGTPEQLKAALRIKVDAHETDCTSRINFFLEPEMRSDNCNLGMMCDSCDYLYIL